MEVSNFSRVETSRNLYHMAGRYYRLYGIDTTPNGCWVLGAKMVLLRDIDIASGQDVIGVTSWSFGEGTVGAYNEYIRYSK